MKKLSFMLVFVSSLAACELQPAPKQAPPAPGSAVAPPAGSAAVVEGSGAGSEVAPPPRRPVPPPAPPAIQVTAECQKTGIKVAELMINDAGPSQKPSIERERTDIVRATEEACTRLGWTPSALACIAQSKTNNDAHACLAKFPPPGAPSAAGSGAGSGSATPAVPRPHPHRSGKGPS